MGPTAPKANADSGWQRPWGDHGQGQICAELDRVRNDYRELLDAATVAELGNPTGSTQWSNEQLLFHMLFFGTACAEPALAWLRISCVSDAHRSASPRS
jgi:hypothetical protein